MKGNRGDDLLNGGLGDDSLRGGRGDDTLIGGDGSDDLRGDRGAHTFIFTADDTGFDRVRDFDGDLDIVVLAGFGACAETTFVQDGRSVILRADGRDIAEFDRAQLDEFLSGTNVIQVDEYMV